MVALSKVLIRWSLWIPRPPSQSWDWNKSKISSKQSWFFLGFSPHFVVSQLLFKSTAAAPQKGLFLLLCCYCGGLYEKATKGFLSVQLSRSLASACHFLTKSLIRKWELLFIILIHCVMSDIFLLSSLHLLCVVVAKVTLPTYLLMGQRNVKCQS